MAFWGKLIKRDPSWLAHVSRLEDRLLHLEKDVEIERDRAHAAVMAVAKALDEAEARIARIESRSARLDQGQGQVKEWLPVLARMQEVTLAAMGHADMAQQFGLTDRQREQAQDEKATTWMDEPIPDTTPGDDGITYG